MLELEKFADEMIESLKEAEEHRANHDPAADNQTQPAPFLTATRLELSTRGLTLEEAESLLSTVSFEDLLGPYTLLRKPVAIDLLLEEMKVCDLIVSNLSHSLISLSLVLFSSRLFSTKLKQ